MLVPKHVLDIYKATDRTSEHLVLVIEFGMTADPEESACRIVGRSPDGIIGQVVLMPKGGAKKKKASK